MDTDRIFVRFLIAAIMIGLMVLMLFSLFVVIDSLTSKHYDTELSPCIDRNGDPFVDELCEKELYCSWLGLYAPTRCSKVKNQESSYE